MQRELILLLSALVLSSAGAADTKLYTVVDGNKVDANTFTGWKTWRALACERCHGNEQQGLVGPSLVDSLKVLTKQQFHDTVFNGRPEKGMPNWGGSVQIQQNWENLYAYLKGRSDGAILPGHLSLMEGASPTAAVSASSAPGAGAADATAPAAAAPAAKQATKPKPKKAAKTAVKSPSAAPAEPVKPAEPT